MTVPGKGGPPKKIQEEELRKLEDAFKIGCTDMQACQHAGIASSTFYDYQKAHPEFSEQKALWKQNPCLKAKYTVYQNLDDPKIAMDYLKARDDDFKPTVRQEISGGLSIQKVFVTKEELDEIDKQIDGLLNE